MNRLWLSSSSRSSRKPRVCFQLAGRDTADIWHEYPPLQASIGHQMASVAWQEPRHSGGHGFHDTFHMTEFDVGREAEVQTMRTGSALHETGEIHVMDMVTIPDDSDDSTWTAPRGKRIDPPPARVLANPTCLPCGWWAEVPCSRPED